MRARSGEHLGETGLGLMSWKGKGLSMYFWYEGRVGEKPKQTYEFQLWLMTLFPVGGRKRQSGCKDLEAEGSEDSLHCNFWTLGGHHPHHGVTLYPEHSQPLSAITHQKINDLCWSWESVWTKFSCDQWSTKA